ncbi:MAG: TlpA disulfide reductase family protein [Proteobacteria bacterium]|nr:TlpA disulfide reductase family protein [Pseudomonadota bacterium]
MKSLRIRPSALIQLAAPALLGLVMAVSVSLSRPLADTEPGKCAGADRVFTGFTAQDPPKPVSKQSFIDANGNQQSLEAHRGRGVVFNFWATWCAPCVREMPQLDRLKALLEPDGIDVVALSEDRKGATLVKKFYRINKLKNLAINIDEGGKVLRDSRVIGLPATLFINADGLEIGRVYGISEWDSKESVAFLRRCLKP